MLLCCPGEAEHALRTHSPSQCVRLHALVTPSCRVPPLHRTPTSLGLQGLSLHAAVVMPSRSWDAAHPAFQTWRRLRDLMEGRPAWARWWAGLAGRKPRQAAAALAELTAAGDAFWAAAEACKAGDAFMGRSHTPLGLARKIQEPAQQQ